MNALSRPRTVATVVAILLHAVALISGKPQTSRDMSATTNIASSPPSLELIFHLIETADIHPLWLRERCRENFYADPDTRQPRYNLHEEIENLTVIDAAYRSGEHRNNNDTLNEAEDGKAVVVVTFSDNNTCALSVKMLQAELDESSEYFLQALEWELPSILLWNASFLAPRVFEHDEIVNVTMDVSSQRSLQFLSTLLSTGIAVVSNVPQNPGECNRFGTHFSTIRETEWGIFNVRSTPDDNGGVQRKDLAYTPRAIGMHIDNAYRVDTPPAFQLLHAMDHCDAREDPVNCQVHNKFVDGFAVAQTLCRENRDMFDILTTTVLRWENNGGDDSSLLYRYAPMIELSRNQIGFSKENNDCPTVEAISFSAKSGGYAPNLPKEEMDLFYRAKRKFSDMLHSPKFTIKSQLYPGALVIFDNRRVLHSRSAIAREDGPRWLQGCYICRDGLLYLYERLRRQLRKDIPAWRNLQDANVQDFDAMGEAYDSHVSSKTISNLLAMLESQKEAYLGAPVSLYEHNLQTASRALRDGQDDETVVVSLFHDIFETLAVKNHGELAASMLAPWISPRSQWLLAHHEIFQGYYYFEHYGLDKNARDMFIDSPYYDWTVEWCERYDQASFNKDYPTLPVEAFLPAVERVLRRPPYWWNPAHPKAGAVSAVTPHLSNEESEVPSDHLHNAASPTGASDPSGSRAIHSTASSLLVESGTSCPDTWTCYG